MARSGIWNGSISFGLLNIPVVLKSADESKDLHFNMLDQKDFSPIKFKRVNAKTGHEVPYSRIIKGYQYESGEYVVLSKADFQAANPKATQAIDIEDFVEIEDVDPMLFEKPYYLVPQKNGVKGYYLLRDALRKTAKAAIGKIVIRTKQHLVAILPREEYLICEVLRFPHEVRGVNEVDYLDEVVGKGQKYNPRELKMAEELIAGMTEKWKPAKYKDTYYDDLMKRIKAKIKSGQSHTVTEPEKVEAEEPSSKVVDLLPLLRKSLESRGHKKVSVHHGRKKA